MHKNDVGPTAAGGNENAGQEGCSGELCNLSTCFVFLPLLPVACLASAAADSVLSSVPQDKVTKLWPKG